MRSVPQAMIWELLYRGRWALPAAVLGANAMPLLILGAISLQGGLEHDDPSLLILHIVLTLVNIMGFGAAVAAAQGSPSRLYTAPISTAALVTWQMLPGMALVAAQTALSGAALAAAFDLNWPIWGPALFSAAAFALILAVMWLTDKSAWVLPGLTLAALVLGLWYKSRHGATFSAATHLWHNVTAADVGTLLLIVGAAFWIAVIGLSRNRRGDRLPALGIIAWIERVFDPVPRFGQPFQSPAEAQFWFEWRKKGWSMPAIVLFGMVVGLSGWLIFSRSAAALLEGFAAGGGFLSAGAIAVGLIMGHCGNTDADFTISQFQATRPMLSTVMARTILKMIGQSLLIGWTIWAVAFAVLYLSLVPTGYVQPPDMLRELEWWYFPATLLGPWTIIGVGASMGLTGRATLWLKLFCGLAVIFICGSLLSSYFASREGQMQFHRAFAAVCGVLFVLVTGWTYLAAQRRSFIGTTTLVVAATVWAALTTIIVFASLQVAVVSPTVMILFSGIVALALAPLAAAPLALTWNRIR